MEDMRKEAYRARVQLKKMEHDERMRDKQYEQEQKLRDKHYEQEKYKMKHESAEKRNSAIWSSLGVVTFIIAFAALFICKRQILGRMVF